MSTEERRLALNADEPDLEEDYEQEEEDEEADEQDDEQVRGFHALLHDRRKLVSWALLFFGAIVAVYLVFPKIVGLNDALDKFDDA
jgi:hypothetical protein